MSCPPSYVQEHLSMYREKEAGSYKSQNREFREYYMPMRELSVQKWDVHPVFCVLLDGTIMISKNKTKARTEPYDTQSNNGCVGAS